MPDSSNDSPIDAPLNPALKSTVDHVYDTSTTTPAPLDTTSAKEGQGEGWPLIWLAVTVISVVLAIYFLV